MFELEKVSRMLFVMVLLIAATTLNLAAQERLCITFSKDSEFVQIQRGKDSTITDFRIIRKGYETEEMRKNARKEYYNGSPTEAGYPNFYISFFVTEKSEVINEKKRKELCTKMATVEDLRMNNFKWPKGVRSDLFFLIQKHKNGDEIFWKAALEAIE